MNLFGKSECEVQPEHRHQTKGSIISAIWRVYIILLEQCHPSDYTSKLQEVMLEFERVITERDTAFN